MAKVRTVHRCSACGGLSPRWEGRCGSCGEWNTLAEELDASADASPPGRPPARPLPLADVDMAEWAPLPTGVPELDRVLAGGLVPGSATLLGGEPGVGKSTLVLQALTALARSGARCLLASAEESEQQVRLRADRLQEPGAGLWVVAETSLPGIHGAVEELRPDVLVVDSIHTVLDPELPSAPGSVAQVRHCAHRLVQAAKQRAMATVLVGHVTKDGSLAGPRVLEHVVDTVLAFEGERHQGLRLLRAVKHRFGPTGELGVFEMGQGGLAGVPDPSGLLLCDRQAGVVGSVVVPAVDGHRPLLVEVQALVTPSSSGLPRRSAHGVDAGRLALVLAVLERRGISLAGLDVFASAVGGVRLVEPAADLALAVALASALTGRPVPGEVVTCGEVGLSGEVRRVPRCDRRLAEAARMGFRQAVAPPSSPDVAGMRMVRVPTLGHALGHLGLDLPSNMGSRARPAQPGHERGVGRRGPRPAPA